MSRASATQRYSVKSIAIGIDSNGDAVLYIKRSIAAPLRLEATDPTDVCSHESWFNDTLLLLIHPEWQDFAAEVPVLSVFEQLHLKYSGGS